MEPLNQYTSKAFLQGNMLAVCALLLFVFAAYFFLIRRARTHLEKAKLPRYDQIPSSSVKHIANKQVLRDLDGKIDVAVIGSGVGGLSTAAVLARRGLKVVVFEQNETVGGCTHTFEKEGFEFDTGVHYVGAFSRPVRKMFDILSDGQLKWTKLDRVYDIMYNAKTGERIEMTDDHAENRRKLTEHFNIDAKTWAAFDAACFWAKFWSHIVFQLKLWHPFLLRVVWPLVAVPYHRYALRATSEALKDFGFSPEAAGALTYHWGDHCVPPQRCPLFLTALLDVHYKGGGYFPRGGSRSIAKTLTAAIERRGGRVFALSSVEKVLTKTGIFGQHSAVGVRVRGVDIHVQKFVVSDAGFLKTFGIDNEPETRSALIDHEVGAAQRALMHTVKGADAVSPCIADLALFIGLDRTDEELGLPALNVWHLSKDFGWDHDEAFDALMTDTYPGASTAEHTPFLFISNESAKDPDFTLRHPGKSTSEVFAVVNFDLFEKWAGTTHNTRDEEYLALKERLTTSYLEAFYLHFPQARGHVCFSSLGTPLTMNKFLGRARGEVYGLDLASPRFDSWEVQRALHPQTYVKHLYLAGEDPFLLGVTACMISGFITSARAHWWSWIYVVPLAAQVLPVLFFG